LKYGVQSEQSILSEEEILRKAQLDAKAFRPLYEKYFKMIFLFILHRVGDKELSADLTSQVFLKAMVNIGQYQFRGLPFSSWLYRIAINECHSFFRKKKHQRLVVLEDVHVDLLQDEMFGHSWTEELRSKLPYILEKLKPEELQLIELRFLESRPFKEVAEILNITETYAKVRTYRVLDKMKKLFIESGS
jgi:RNA polymerase sigma-70 factor, ECF subfamily